MILGNIEVEDEKVVLQVVFEDVDQALGYCIDHEIMISPKFIDEGSSERA